MADIVFEGVRVGILLRSLARGTTAVTDRREPLQLVSLRHPGGTTVSAHMHARRTRVTTGLQECVIVKTGRIRLELYSPSGTMFRRITLKAGDAFILQRGGYGIQFLEASEVLEVKNGPYLDDKMPL